MSGLSGFPLTEKRWVWGREKPQTPAAQPTLGHGVFCPLVLLPSPGRSLPWGPGEAGVGAAQALGEQVPTYAVTQEP